MIRQLEEGLKDINLFCVRRLQVVEIPKDTQEHRDSPSPIEEPSNDGKNWAFAVSQTGLDLALFLPQKCLFGAGEISQFLRSFALMEDSGLVPSTNTVACKLSVTPVLGIPCPLWP